MSNETNITAGRIAAALLAALLTAAEREIARAEAIYTPEQLEAAWNNMGTGGHVYYPAAEHYFRRSQEYLQLHSYVVLARGRIARDRRNGQLELDLGTVQS